MEPPKEALLGPPWSRAKTRRDVVVAQHGQVFPLKSRGTETRWAYRYRVGGRGSRRVQRGGFQSERAAVEALERALELLRREQGLRRCANSSTSTSPSTMASQRRSRAPLTLHTVAGDLRRALHGARPPGLVLVRKPDQLGLADYVADGHVAVITLNRPHADNAITTEMGARLTEILETIAVRPSIRVAIVTGAGTRAELVSSRRRASHRISAKRCARRSVASPRPPRGRRSSRTLVAVGPRPRQGRRAAVHPSRRRRLCLRARRPTRLREGSPGGVRGARSACSPLAGRARARIGARLAQRASGV
jgi:hypothetical protein